MAAPTQLHVSVLADEVTRLLAETPPGRVVDFTFGAGGHSRRLLQQNPEREIIAVDRDPSTQHYVEALKSAFPKAKLTFLNQSFAEAAHMLCEQKVQATAILADLGISSMQIDQPERGFSYRNDGPLDLRMNQQIGEPAHAWLRKQSLDELTHILRTLGEEPLARPIAQAIIQRNSDPKTALTTTSQLSQLIEEIYRKHYRKPSQTPPPAKTFQAIRMALNQELDELDQLLQAIPIILAPGGRAAVITFHSLEDRAVKTFFRHESKDCHCPPDFPVCRCGHKALWKILKPFPIRPSEKEMQMNQRARSAMMRVVEKYS